MNNVGEKFLPIGTVVMLAGGKKRVMITGFCSIPTDDTSKIYDYTGCMFPEGFLSSEQTILFNHNQIENIYHMGLIDEEEQNFKKQLIPISEELSKEMNKVFDYQLKAENVVVIGPEPLQDDKSLIPPVVKVVGDLSANELTKEKTQPIVQSDNTEQIETTAPKFQFNENGVVTADLDSVQEGKE